MIRDLSLIMLIEDNDDHAEFITTILTDLKASKDIIRFPDAESALESLMARVEKNTHGVFPDIILLDIKLPGMSGIEFLKKTSAYSWIRRIPTVMLTTSKYDEDISKSYELGACSYIVKPVDYDEFVEKMKSFKKYWMLTSPILPKNKIIETSDLKQLSSKEG